MVSDADRVAAFRGVEPGSADAAFADGWFLVLELYSKTLVRSYCWRVPNWTEVPVRPCPACQRGLR